MHDAVDGQSRHLKKDGFTHEDADLLAQMDEWASHAGGRLPRIDEAPVHPIPFKKFSFGRVHSNVWEAWQIYLKDFAAAFSSDPQPISAGHAQLGRATVESVVWTLHAYFTILRNPDEKQRRLADKYLYAVHETAKPEIADWRQRGPKKRESDETLARWVDEAREKCKLIRARFQELAATAHGLGFGEAVADDNVRRGILETIAQEGIQHRWGEEARIHGEDEGAPFGPPEQVSLVKLLFITGNTRARLAPREMASLWVEHETGISADTLKARLKKPPERMGKKSTRKHPHRKSG